MSLIQFRGRPILSPLIKHDSIEENDPRIKEDDIILSLPSSEALQAILCGLPENSVYGSRLKDKPITKPVSKSEKKFTNFKECNSSVHSGLSKENGTNKVTFIRYKPSSNNLKYKNNIQVMQSSKYLLKSSGDHEPLLLKDSHYSKDSNPTQNEKRIHNENDTYTSAPSTPSKVSNISNHQKLKVLRSSGTDSSSYLQDYLQLLTSRTDFIRVVKPKREAELKNDVFMERRGSAPSLASKKCVSNNDRHRTSSGSSDKSGSSRSLGSTYLDSYLGNLTDHSWIIYPTTEVTTSASQPQGTENSSSPESSGDYLQRKLRFIDPEKFFTIENKIFNGECKMDTLEEPSHATSILKSSSSAENDNELGLTDTSGIVLSPDISSSSLDTDKLDASNPLSLASLQEIDEIKESPKSQELSSEIKDHTMESSYNSDTSPEDKSLSSKNGDAPKSSSSKLNVTFDTEPCETISPRSFNSASVDQSTQEDEEDIKDESTIADDSSDLSSDDDAEDQVSMIVCDIQKSSESLHNESKESLCDDSLITKPTSSSLVSQASSDQSILENVAISVDSLPLSQENPETMPTVVDKFESEEIMSKLVKILQAKQEEELIELRQKHEREMEAFVNELSKLTSTQKSALANAYESPNNNNSLNEMLKNLNSVSQGSSQLSDSSDLNSEHKEHFTSLSSFNHTNLMPSFFLHDENQENNSIRRSDVNKISQIFSPSKGTIQNVAKFLNLSPKTLTVKSEAEAEQTEPVKQLFSQKQLEVGLDLVPTRESDGVCTSSSSSTVDLRQEGISKLQAIVRGRRIRKLMRTAQVQQLLATLKEVAKLAHQFHQDILMDNIRKGDIGFHKALYNEEQQAREKLIHVMVELNPIDQIRLIQRDRLLGERETQRRVTTEQPRSNANHIPRLKLYATLPESSIKSQSSPRALLLSPHKGISKPLPKKILTSELPRPCKAAIALDPKPTVKHPCISPREKQSLIPYQKSWVSKGIPKHRITKKIDTLPLTHIPPRRQNAPICKSDSGYLSSSGVKPTKIGSSLPVREDVVASKKPWR